MKVNKIGERLIEQGQKLFEAKKKVIEFTKVVEADKLLNNLKNYPHAFVLACVMDRQIRAELAWLIPFRIAEKLGNFKFSTLENLSISKVKELIQKPEPLHHFPEQMGKNFFFAIQRIKKGFDGNATKIWAGCPSSAEVVYRFLQFRGIGQKIATMATNILDRD